MITIINGMFTGFDTKLLRDVIFVLTASELLIYSWSRVDAPMPTGAIFSDYNRVVIIHNVQLAHEGTYRCRVTRQLGQETYGDLTIAIEGTFLSCST